jgi:hypothetical protein
MEIFTIIERLLRELLRGNYEQFCAKEGKRVGSASLWHAKAEAQFSLECKKSIASGGRLA